MSGSTTPAPISLSAAIQRYFDVALYLLVLTGFGTLASTGKLKPITVLLVGAALVFRGYLLASRRSFLIPERWTTALTLAYVAFAMADYFLLSSGFLKASVHLVLFVMVVRMFSAQRERDYYFLSVLAFLMVLSAAVLTVDSTFVLAFAGFMLTAVVTFILMEMRHISAKATVHSKDATDRRDSRQMAYSLTGAAPALVVCILLGAAVIFFVMPRISTGYLSGYSPSTQLTTGFSERVELGSIGEIQQSSSVVMHIQIDADRDGDSNLLWRGVALGTFDGKVWSTPPEQRLVPRLPDGRFVLSQGETQSPVSPVVRYHVLMEPLGTNVFFLAAAPLTLQGNYGLLARDSAGSVFDFDPAHPISIYDATSRIAQLRPADLGSAGVGYPLDVRLNYTRLPDLDPRIPQLAAQITAASDNNYDRAVAIEKYLATHFAYSLQLSRTTPRDPLAEFLFERRKGHCEYFASSMAVMLRTLGIPSRVVNGFRTGEFNNLTSQYVVRASDAHSWVEAYFPGYGWVSFDPTPAASLPTRNGWSRVGQYLDAMASFWREWVINYDLNRQQNLGATVAGRGQQLIHETRLWWFKRHRALLTQVRRVRDTLAASPLRWSLFATLGLAALLLAANGGRLWRAWARRRLVAHPETAPSKAASIWYGKMTRVLARRGWRKLPTQTAREFVVQIDDREMRGRVERFTQHYANARFGDSAEDARRLPELYEEISNGTKG